MITPAPPKNLIELFENHFRPIRLIGTKQVTQKGYRITLRHFTAFLARVATLDDFTDETVARFMSWCLESRGMAIPTVNAQRRYLLCLWRFSKKKKWVIELPDVPLLKEYKRVPQAWSIEQLGAIVQAARETPGYTDVFSHSIGRVSTKKNGTLKYFPASSPLVRTLGGVEAKVWWPALILFLYDTGLRIGTAMALEPSHLDFETGWLHVPAEIQKHKSDGRFKLHPDTLAEVKNIHEGKTFERLFPWSWTRATLYKHFREILDRAGVPVGTKTGCLFHRIRKTSATYVASKMGRAAAIDHLGHSCVSVTERYLDVTKIERIQAADVLPRPKEPT